MICTWNQRLTYAFVGIFAGDIALVLYMLLNAFLVRSSLMAAHVGEPERQVAITLQAGTIYVVCSLVGFLIVGVPVALLLPTRIVARWKWLITLAVGALLGPAALFIILEVLSGGSLSLSSSLSVIGPLFAFSTVVSTVSFGVYVALLRKQLGRPS